MSGSGQAAATGVVPVPRAAAPAGAARPASAPPRPSPAWRRLRATALLTLMGVAGTVTLWLRLPAVARDTFWAEDGRNFISNAAHSGLGALFRPYAGYLHTVPRLIASAVVLLPVPLWAVATTAGACAAAGVLAVVVFVAADGIVPWMPARLLLAGLTVLAPLGPREVLGDLANLHSVFLWALFWVVLSRPRGRTVTAMFTAVALLGALTEIQALVLLPLLLVVRTRDRRAWTVRAGLLIGLAAQVFVAIVWPRPHNPDPLVSLPSLGYGYLINAATPLVVPQRLIGPVLAATGPAVGVAVLVCVAAATALVVRAGTRRQRIAALAAVTISPLLYVVDVEMNPSTLYAYASLSRHGLRSVWLVRYGVVPSVLLASVVLIAAAVAVARRRRAATARHALARGVFVTLAAVLTVLVAVQLAPQQTRRSAGPAWRPQIAAAADVCSDHPGQAAVLMSETLGWTVRVPCADLLRHRV